MYLSEIIESFQIFELFIFLFYSIGFDSLYIIINKYKKVLFVSKSNKYDRCNKISVNILVILCYS